MILGPPLSLLNLAAALDVLPVGALILRPDGVCVHANAAWTTFTHDDPLGDGGTAWCAALQGAEKLLAAADILEESVTVEVALPPAVEGAEPRWGRLTRRAISEALSCIILEDITSSRRAGEIIRTQHEVMVAEADVEVVMRTVVERTQALTGADAGVVEMVDDDSMVYRAASGTAAPYVGLRLPIGTSLSGLCARSGEVIRCDDTETDPRVDREACRRVGAASMIVVPLRQPGRVSGVLKVLSKRPRAFHEGHVRTLELMSGVISTALSHAEELRLRAVAVEASRRAQRAAEESNRAKSDFLAKMSHEIRTPMNGILGMAQVALECPMTDELHGYVANIGRCGEELLSLLNDILDLSKIEAGRLEIEQVDVDLADLLDGVRHTFALGARQAGIAFEVTRAAGVPARVTSDPTRLRQILVNLLGNAFKFTSSGKVELVVSRAEKDVEFTVRDTGVGIPEEKQRMIFEPFSQADVSTARHFGGTGLGLSITLQLVTLMGGGIRLDSVVGQGTTFVVTLPLPASTPSTVTPADVAAVVRPLRILLAEDDEVSQLVAVMVLTRRGHQVDVVDDGPSVLQKAANETYDVILTDIELPAMNGFEVARALRAADGPNRGTPVIACTAHNMKGDRERFLAEGLDGYVSKPLNVEKLMAELAAVTQ